MDLTGKWDFERFGFEMSFQVTSFIETIPVYFYHDVEEGVYHINCSQADNANCMGYSKYMHTDTTI